MERVAKPPVDTGARQPRSCESETEILRPEDSPAWAGRRNIVLRVAASGKTMGPIRILIADDHAIIRRGLRTLLEHESGFEVIAEASDGREAIEAAKRERPHVVVLDIGMPGLNGIEACRQIAGLLPESQIVMLTVQADEAYLLGALKAGARGYVLKSSAESEIVDAVRAVSQGVQSTARVPA